MLVTYRSVRLVWFEIRGEDVGKFRTREDGGLVTKFCAWLCERDAPRSRGPGGTVGGGVWCGGFSEEDAPRVAAWLAEHGVVSASDDEGSGGG